MMTDTSSTSRIVDHWVFDNSGTVVLGLESMRQPLAQLAGGVVDATLLTKLERTRAERMDRRVFVVVAFGEASRGGVSLEVAVLDVGAAGEQPGHLPGVVTLGRHGCCDFGRLEGAALRHAILLAHPPSDGEPACIEALDLASGVGLGVGLGQGATQLLATGQMRFGVGAFSVLAFFAEPHVPLFPEGVEAAVVTLDRGAQEFGAHLHVPATEREDASPTRALRHLGADPDRIWSEGSHATMGSVVVSLDPSAFVLEATAEELRDGVLLGRYPRCQGTLELCRDGSVSRVHALILRRRGRTLLIDCGSTNGTELRPAKDAPVSLGPNERVWPIDPGDDIWFGKVRLRFTLVGDADA